MIVYARTGTPQDAGHIDFRSYDGYISDFWDSYLPTSQFTVTGIYRKYYDSLPEKRLRAFLRVIRSREAETIFMSLGDAAAYRARPMSSRKHGEPAPTFQIFKEHPFAHVNNGALNPAGAYGITSESWKKTLAIWFKLADSEDKFSPIVQDGIAVALMEMHPGVGYGTASYQTTLTTSLGLI